MHRLGFFIYIHFFLRHCSLFFFFFYISSQVIERKWSNIAALYVLVYRATTINLYVAFRITNARFILVRIDLG